MKFLPLNASSKNIIDSSFSNSSLVFLSKTDKLKPLRKLMSFGLKFLVFFLILYHLNFLEYSFKMRGFLLRFFFSSIYDIIHMILHIYNAHTKNIQSIYNVHHDTKNIQCLTLYPIAYILFCKTYQKSVNKRLFFSIFFLDFLLPSLELSLDRLDPEAPLGVPQH